MEEEEEEEEEAKCIVLRFHFIRPKRLLRV
jgi:hypothetical protein